MASGWFTNDGPLVKELELGIADYLRVRHCVLTANGTVALQILSHALELTGEVIVPSFTFVATPNAMKWQGLDPVFCDIDPRTLNIDPESCEALITERTSAILGVHLWGRPCDIPRLRSVADRHGIHLIFDAAHGFGCGHDNALIGNFGDAEVFSLHATKAFHCGEGGAITTADDGLAERLREIRNFGFVAADTTTRLGINAKMPELSAALGLANLEALAESISRSRRVIECYQAGLRTVPGIEIRPCTAPRHNFHYAVAELDQGSSGISRDLLVEVLESENVLARKYFFPGCHKLAPYHDESCDSLPHTEFAAERSLILPAGPEMSPALVDSVCELLGDIVSNAEHLSLLSNSSRPRIA